MTDAEALGGARDDNVGMMVNARAESSAIAGGERLDIRVGELRQLFNSMDAAPFRERDLDPKAEEFILDWAREVRADGPLALYVHVSGQPATHEESSTLRQCICNYFALRASAERTRLRRLLRTGRWNLLIGILFVAAATAVGDWLGSLVGRYNYGRLLQESIAIGGWVALWRPMEIFLYDWWPIRAEARIYDRLSALDVHLVGVNSSSDLVGTQP